MPDRKEIPTENNREAVFRYYSRLARVRDRLLQDISLPLSAEDAARIADLSPNYFSTYFRQRVGMSYTRWAHSIRIACARELLRSSDLGIGEVARRVGYRDLRTFERAFKRERQTTPRAYRQHVRPGGMGPGGILPPDPGPEIGP